MRTPLSSRSDGWLSAIPFLMRRIADAGHEIASHGHWHRRVNTLTPEEFREDMRVSKAILEEHSGAPVWGFRAPNFSISPGTEWAFDILIEEGFRYDSSLFPIRRPGYGYPKAPPRSASHPSARGHAHGAAARDHAVARHATPRGRRRVSSPSSVLGSSSAPFVSTMRAASPQCSTFIRGSSIPISRGSTVPWHTHVRHYGGLRKTQPLLERLLGEFRFRSVAQCLKLPTSNATSSRAASAVE